MPGIYNISAAPDTRRDGQPPASGWVHVSLPDYWQTRWPEHNSVWYRLDWHHCQPNQLQALTVSQLSMAGEIHLNDSLLWRSASLQEPYSRNWNTPRFWLLPQAALVAGDNTVWIRVTGNIYDRLGLGTLSLGEATAMAQIYDRQSLFQREVFVLNAAISLALGGLFLTLWALRRTDTAFAWFGFASLLWAVFASTMLASSPWPFTNSIDWNRTVLVILMMYCCAFCLFTWRFGNQQWPRLSITLKAATVAIAVGIWWLPDAWMPLALAILLPTCALLFVGNCVQFQFHAWRQRERHIVLLAVCLLCFMVVGVRDALVVATVLPSPHLWAPASSPIAMLFMFIIVADRYAQSFRRIEQFNTELQTAVDTTRADLTQTLQHKHELEASNIRLTERLKLSHDLHDSLGSTLVRSIALVEQSSSRLDNNRFLSMLKELRDDLRQVIDSNSPSHCADDTTPSEWIAPLRQRFVRLFDEQDITSRWTMPAQWPRQLSSIHRMELTRFIEEALSNAIKHSGADTIEVTMAAGPQGDGLVLEIRDNGRGFDVDAARRDSGVGMRSMAARVSKMGGQLLIHSRPGETVVLVELASTRA